MNQPEYAVWPLPEHVQCPGCGGQPVPGPESSAGACARCGTSWRVEPTHVRWGAAQEPEAGAISGQSRNLRWYWTHLRQAPGRFARSAATRLSQRLHPLHGTISPLKRLHVQRLERYYERTLTDLALARSWAEHYLSGLPLPRSCKVLEHGCGRGRHLALLAQLGWSVHGQDIAPDPWWERLPQAVFQVAPMEFPLLPWKDASFDLVLNFMVTDYLTEDLLLAHAREVSRVLSPGGAWVVFQANPLDMAARALLKKFPRAALHSPEQLAHIGRQAGLREHSLEYEGVSSPVLPVIAECLRKTCLTRCFDMTDYRSLLTRFVPPKRRSHWLMRLVKGNAAGDSSTAGLVPSKQREGA